MEECNLQANNALPGVMVRGDGEELMEVVKTRKWPQEPCFDSHGALGKIK